MGCVTPVGALTTSLSSRRYVETTAPLLVVQPSERERIETTV